MYFVPIYILILAGTIIIDYIAGLVIEKSEGSKRKAFLVLSLVTNIGILAVFKYYNFFIENINAVSSLNMPFLTILLPIGLSFHTFQAMSYTIEVYRGNQKAERNFGIYALYVMFYPQLVAGPIERPQNVLHQFHEKQYFKYENVVSGLRLMMWGLIKKMVVADRLAGFTSNVFNDPGNASGTSLLIGTIFFSFQIYCDFSGYSDIAIGAARVMGFKLMTNFNKPYHARSISEFWKRWHISLSTWFKDYLYIPLGGNRVSVSRGYFNLFFVFLVSGFWHGANWTFIIWGALHGFYLVFAIISRDGRQKVIDGLGISKIGWLNNAINVTTVFFLVTVTWVFFRANTLKDALAIFKKFLNIPSELTQVFHERSLMTLNFPRNGTFIVNSFMIIILLELIQTLEAKYRISETFAQKPMVFRWGIYITGIISILFLGNFNSNSFIYFQF
ncbi:MBOAT family O-acyltransferase [Hufsiella arboris]|nr:MBOAT family O-acyltransferase [Hufsiella arboris]